MSKLGMLVKRDQIIDRYKATYRMYQRHVTSGTCMMPSRYSISCEHCTTCEELDTELNVLREELFSHLHSELDSE